MLCDRLNGCKAVKSGRSMNKCLCNKLVFVEEEPERSMRTKTNTNEKNKQIDEMIIRK